MIRRACGLVLALGLSPAAFAGSVVINEFSADPDGTDAGGEWIELANVSSGSIDLSGWKIERAKSSWGAVYTIPDGTSLGAGGYLLIGESRVAGADLVPGDGELDLGNAGSNGDGVRLTRDDGGVEDTVIYGANNDDALVDDGGAPATSLAPKPASGKSTARIPDGADTDRSGADFQVHAGTPGAPNPGPTACQASTGGIVVNELLPDPPGADGTALSEWVELYARSGSTDLEGWKLEIASKPDSWKLAAQLDGVISSGDFLVVGEPNAPVRDLSVPLLGLFSGSGGDAVRLVDCKGTVVDTVVYGSDNADAMTDDSGGVATSWAPKPGEGKSIGRAEDGVDTNQSGVDFRAFDAPTPGEAVPPPPVCEAGGAVRLNELLPDPAGTDGDAGTEFVELFNAGSAAIDLGGWGIGLATKADDEGLDVVLPGGTTIAPGDFLVIGGPNAGPDVPLTTAIPNGTGGDAVRLVDCEGSLIDVVVYGGDNEDGMKDESGGVAEVSGDPGSDQSLARRLDGDDSDAPDDWFVDRTPTPGASNYEEPDTDTDPDDSGDDFQPGCGGGGGPPDGEAPSGGCQTIPGGGPAALLAIVALARRRRRIPA